MASFHERLAAAATASWVGVGLAEQWFSAADLELDHPDAALIAACPPEMVQAWENGMKALKRAAEAQPEALAMLEANGFVFATTLGKPDEERTEAERWEKLAFTLYTMLCELELYASPALAVYDAQVAALQEENDDDV